MLLLQFYQCPESTRLWYLEYTKKCRNWKIFINNNVSKCFVRSITSLTPDPEELLLKLRRSVSLVFVWDEFPEIGGGPWRIWWIGCLPSATKRSFSRISFLRFLLHISWQSCHVGNLLLQRKIITIRELKYRCWYFASVFCYYVLVLHTLLLSLSSENWYDWLHWNGTAKHTLSINLI